MVTQTLCVERHVSVTVQTEAAAALGESIQRLLPNTRDVAMNLMRSQLLETVGKKLIGLVCYTIVVRS